jgi:nitric oxide reductase NorD protein
MTLEIEKQALLLLGAVLDGIGDAFALHGFQGRSRLRCELLRIKDFGDRYGAMVPGRVSQLQPSGYTRGRQAQRGQ